MHENDAFMAYLENYFHPSGDKEMLRKAGFYIGDSSFIGASPDGIIEREGNIYKIIEIKCLFCFRNSSVEEACTKNTFNRGRFAPFKENAFLLLPNSRSYGSSRV